MTKNAAPTPYISFIKDAEEIEFLAGCEIFLFAGF